ncbi:JAB domain-containing protein [Cryptosporidium canis]|uniref:JAB domain-containing protein n=1 Tax=Cryptosporidium canis TaxID=195482 RepID=A0A9D5DID4_9CRYT|nr:JAB domain-containing protein [Cryptosporidium canis]
MNIEFSRESYERILSQSMKYPMSCVDGVLIGFLSEQNTLIVADSFPLTHGPKLPHIITIGMQYAQGYCDILNRSNTSTRHEIIGFYSTYHYDRHFGTEDTKLYFNLISEKLLADNSESIHVTVHDRNALSGDCLNVRLLRNKQLLNYKIVNSTGPNMNKLIRNLEYYNINDIEDHLSNPKLEVMGNSLLLRK